MLHQIVRRRHPSVRILMGKYDVKAAYHHAHLSSTTAAESLTIFNNTPLMALCMTFGGKPCPAQWGCLLETTCDLANDLIQCKEWNYLEPPCQIDIKYKQHSICQITFHSNMQKN